MQTDPLFVGLTRPSMIFGVSMNFMGLNMILCMMYFLQSGQMKSLFAGVFIHMIGYVICFKDPRIIEIYLNKLQKCNQCPNKGFYGANSYMM